MTTRREQIVLAVIARLATVPGVTGVHRSRDDAMSREESPALAVRWVDDEPRAYVHPYTEKHLLIEVGVYQRGTEPDALADPVCEAVHAALMTEPTLGGLCMDLDEDGTRLETDESDACSGWITMRFRAWYRHRRDTLTA